MRCALIRYRKPGKFQDEKSNARSIMGFIEKNHAFLEEAIMRYLRLGAAALALALVAACGGSDGAGDQAPKIRYSKLVSFGDSLSDVGTYKVGTVAALGGGQYTINSPSGGANWIELMAKTLQLPAPCPAQTGLDGAAQAGFSVPVTNNANCFAYGQGGARVTNPVGPGNKLLGGNNATLGQLTVPVITQMQNHLAKGAFQGNEIVFILAGGNDVFINLAFLSAGAATPEQAGAAMGLAGAELAGYIKQLILANGARYVVVVNLPDVGKTPFAYQLEAAAPGTAAFVTQISKAFNDQLAQGLAGANVLLVDAFTVSQTQAASPAQFGLTNVQLPACDLSAQKNILGTALVCNSNNLTAGGPVDKYQFADGVHPTPYGYQLLAQLVGSEMAKKGWL
jgi:outer membrane lipase/esterase